MNKRIRKKQFDLRKDKLYSYLYFNNNVSKARRHRIYLRTRTLEQKRRDFTFIDNVLLDLGNLAKEMQSPNLFGMPEKYPSFEIVKREVVDE